MKNKATITDINGETVTDVIFDTAFQRSFLFKFYRSPKDALDVNSGEYFIEPMYFKTYINDNNTIVKTVAIDKAQSLDKAYAHETVYKNLSTAKAALDSDCAYLFFKSDDYNSTYISDFWRRNLPSRTSERVPLVRSAFFKDFYISNNTNREMYSRLIYFGDRSIDVEYIYNEPHYLLSINSVNNLKGEERFLKKVTFNLDTSSVNHVDASDKFYVGGGDLGSAKFLELTKKKNDSDQVIENQYTGTTWLSRLFSGNYAYFKNPKSWNDWNSKEILPYTTNEAKKTNNWNDRLITLKKYRMTWDYYINKEYEVKMNDKFFLKPTIGSDDEVYYTNKFTLLVKASDYNSSDTFYLGGGRLGNLEYYQYTYIGQRTDGKHILELLIKMPEDVEFFECTVSRKSERGVITSETGFKRTATIIEVTDSNSPGYVAIFGVKGNQTGNWNLIPAIAELNYKIPTGYNLFGDKNYVSAVTNSTIKTQINSELKNIPYINSDANKSIKIKFNRNLGTDLYLKITKYEGVRENDKIKGKKNYNFFINSTETEIKIDQGVREYELLAKNEGENNGKTFTFKIENNTTKRESEEVKRGTILEKLVLNNASTIFGTYISTNDFFSVLFPRKSYELSIQNSIISSEIKQIQSGESNVSYKYETININYSINQPSNIDYYISNDELLITENDSTIDMSTNDKYHFIVEGENEKYKNKFILRPGKKDYNLQLFIEKPTEMQNKNIKIEFVGDKEISESILIYPNGTQYLGHLFSGLNKLVNTKTDSGSNKSVTVYLS